MDIKSSRMIRKVQNTLKICVWALKTIKKSLKLNPCHAKHCWSKKTTRSGKQTWTGCHQNPLHPLHPHRRHRRHSHPRWSRPNPCCWECRTRFPRNRSTRDCARWLWDAPLLVGVALEIQFFPNPWAGAGEVDGCVEWLLPPVLRLTGAGRGGGGRGCVGIGLSGILAWLRGLVMRARGASWMELWMMPLGWWCPRRVVERKRWEWLL